jgi:hypothetical protein
MNMGMGGPYSQGIVNWNNAQMNSPIRSAAQPRTAGSQLRHNGIVDQQVGGYMSESRLPISPPLADRRTPNPNQGGQISPFGGERERRTSFFNSGDDALKRTDSRATIVRRQRIKGSRKQEGSGLTGIFNNTRMMNSPLKATFTNIERVRLRRRPLESRSTCLTAGGDL